MGSAAFDALVPLPDGTSYNAYLIEGSDKIAQGWAMMFITTKRVYDPIDNNEGVRVLVDHLWPRGVSKQALKADHGLREVAPSDLLRQWFGHAPQRLEEFKHRYFAKLQAKPEIIHFLLGLVREKMLVLLYSTRDIQCNQAIALQHYMLSLMQKNKGASQDNGR